MKYCKLLAIACAVALTAGCGKDEPVAEIPTEIPPERMQEIQDSEKKVEAEEKANMPRN